ncbi:MAG: LysR family transcriptional regulator [Gammaproteobacteria bacterium]|nr:LysR family transcriptional regulator [Gammaproteobacteria bacterium]
MASLLEMRSFVGVVEAGSFVGGAEAIGLSKQAVSRHIAELERRLGVRLLHRTTRRLSLTEDGQTFFARARELIDEIDRLEAEVSSGSAEPTGLLRINAPLTFGILHLAPLWGRFAKLYPKVSLEVDLSDRLVDLIEEGYDVAVRISGLPNSTLISRKLATTRLLLCASPGYLKKNGHPATPGELKRHPMISYAYLTTGEEWAFTNPDGAPLRVRTNSRLHTNNGDTCRAAALDDQGVVFLPDFLVADDIRQGRLVELMPDFKGPEIGIYAVYPSRQYLPVKTRRLVDYLVSAFRSPIWQTRGP